jgi:hypothetical protein
VLWLVYKLGTFVLSSFKENLSSINNPPKKMTTPAYNFVTVCANSTIPLL